MGFFDKDALARILKALSSYYGSITALANITKIDRTYLSKYIQGKLKRPPSPKILRNIADNSSGLFTYLELMYICGYFKEDEYSVLKNLKKFMIYT